MRLSDISDTKTLRAGFPDICRAIKEKETDMEVTEKNRTKYRMPGEFEPHEGCVMIWPERPGSWNYGAREAQKGICESCRGYWRERKCIYASFQSSDGECKEISLEMFPV